MPRKAVFVLAICLTAQVSASTYTLVTEPDEFRMDHGLNAIYALIGSAKKTLDMTMYELTDTTAEQLLVKAAESGVTVRVILDQNLEMQSNMPAYTFLSSNGVAMHWANKAYNVTHQKTITVDGATTAIMTLNLTSHYYISSRDFAVIEDNPKDIAAIEATFDADFVNSEITPPNGDDLVWSPTNSQSVILSIINSANDSLLVENEEMADANVTNALMSAAGRGVAVKVIMTNTGNDYATAFNQLVAAGVQVSTYDADASLYIHAKVILADFGNPAAQMFIGSENFSSGSLTRNRELGLVVSDPAIMQSIETTLSADFSGGTAWTGSTPRFSVAASPSILAVTPGSVSASTVNTAVFAGFFSVVRLSASGLPSGVTATFTPDSIAAPGSGTSTLNLAANASATPGTYSITLTGTGGGLTESASLTLTIVTAEVVNTASSQLGFATGGWVTIFGTNLSPVTDDWTKTIVNGVLPASLDGVTVTIDGQPAYPEYISPTQINAVAPNVTPGMVLVTVSAPNGTSMATMAMAQAVQPAFFQWGNYAVATHQDFTYAAKNGAFSGANTVPAAPGEVIILWGTGFGPTTPVAPAGTLTPSDTTYNTAGAVTVTLGTTPATVDGAALAPGFAGLYQVAIQIPESLSDGDYPIIASVAGAQSPPNLLLTVQH